LIEHPLGLRHIPGVSFDHQVMAVGANADVEQRFEVLEILVVGSEKRLDPLVRDCDLSNDCGRRYWRNSL
jgi:hypothetical protein